MKASVDILSDEIIYGSTQGVAQVLRSNPEINSLDSYGYTPLIQTAIVNNVEMASLLISHGADVDQADMMGRTALHWATENNNLSFCQLLLDYKADPNAYSKLSQPVLTTPLLRNHRDVKQLLYAHGADLKFAQDYINTKLIAHRYELLGLIDIVSHKNHYIELELEGFFLEFTLGIIEQSLHFYKRNFAARHLRSYFNNVQKMIDALGNAAQLIKYQQYQIDIRQHENTINALLNTDLLVIPVGYDGHAISFVKHGNLLAKCDRGENSKIEGSIVIYRIHNLAAFNHRFIKDLMYQRHGQHTIHVEVNRILGLEKIDELALDSQLTGNCSWANIEAAVPAMLYFLLLHDDHYQLDDRDACRNAAMYFYKEWLEWDKDRALYDCIQSFHEAGTERQASKASLLAAILFQRCKYPLPKDLERAEKILEILDRPEHHYILASYLKVYTRLERTPEGSNLMKLLEYFDVALR